MPFFTQTFTTVQCNTVLSQCCTLPKGSLNEHTRNSFSKALWQQKERWNNLHPTIQYLECIETVCVKA